MTCIYDFEEHLGKDYGKNGSKLVGSEVQGIVYIYNNSSGGWWLPTLRTKRVKMDVLSCEQGKLKELCLIREY